MRSFVIALASLTSATAAFAICGSDGMLTGSPVSGDNSATSNDITPSCQANNGGDFTYEWIAPSSGLWLFETPDGTDTILVATASDCTTELACDDDSGVGLGSLMELDAVAGQTYLITVDSFLPTGGTGGGPYELSVYPYIPATCTIDGSTGTPLAVLTGNTCGAVNDQDGATCGSGQGSEDVGYSWTAPTTGTYTFSSAGSTFDTALSIWDAADCNVELGCDDDVGGGDLTSELSMAFTAGQRVMISMDGFGSAECGDYTLTITAGCPDDDSDGLCNDVDFCTGDDATGDEDFDGICNSDDFNLEINPEDPAGGTMLNLRANNAAPGSNVFFLLSTRGFGAGPCSPGNIVCADILAPRVVGRAVANMAGLATAAISVPGAAPSGARAFIQAAYIDGGSGETSEVEIATVQ